MSSPVEEIKKRVDIVDLIGSYIRLSKAGANFKAVCPFHNEKTPSFYVSPSREIFHCFGCNAGGDVFRFVSMMEGVEFPEALSILAERAGVVLRREDPRLSGERRKLLNLILDATKYFESGLAKSGAAMDYLRTRGLKDETIKNFRLGFIPDGWDNLLNYLTQKGYKAEEVGKAGFAISSSNPNSRTKYYDRFRSRIMFPIADSSGRIVGFSGRIFNKETNEGKYINTPNTVLYDKSKILYLWDRAKNDVRKENSCVVVEGQMDALMSHQAGITNTVATSGTALGFAHTLLIKRLASKLLLAFDNDTAGETASKRAYELALDSGFEVNVIEVPEGKDPAETLALDPELWVGAIKNAKPIIAFFLDNLGKKFGGDMHKIRTEARTAVLPYVARFSSEIEKAHWVQETAKILQLKEEPLWEEIKKISASGRAGDSQAKEVKFVDVALKTRRHLVEERILGMLVWKTGTSFGVEANLKDLFSKENSTMLEAVLAGKSDFEAALSKFALEAELLYGDADDMAGEVKSLVSELERETVRAKLESLAEEIRKTEAAGEGAKLAEYLNEFQETSRKLNYLWQEANLKK
ncbi:DNA primase [Candidatus Giovannonibacteria bacterium RIFCSPLOWO2_02_FULL_45_14]|uniref:DNA primase n=1 Tax=Candidatus Giovannonibacteria bacterium RIFCSPLOWO2_12_FULL_44_15 TaxID=1798364 RepID=A0A1F5Y0T8_9BACT|nr:MAG: DNA primase [Candidatus Giovannonibacteria bacterium RIFCSPHIGHO2_02_FULL_44_31]OGF77004.1 MAG: DNA primase [Candidatus Giovannonibacteria bacterium RIFCSPHIGHO2_12_FULL_44_29]OGF90966.1 MAG: DNA primase [Candidatus Giovannonibacteria bacterium RIFCSPLOWO2_02_FULL_45_14]OGF93713.1 MAG: DNA primase [Candidatus Giovannonibacteria bacterium RIFCSPLOWO2_12_FULL_44_15]